MAVDSETTCNYLCGDLVPFWFSIEHDSALTGRSRFLIANFLLFTIFLFLPCPSVFRRGGLPPVFRFLFEAATQGKKNTGAVGTTESFRRWTVRNGLWGLDVAADLGAFMLNFCL